MTSKSCLRRNIPVNGIWEDRPMRLGDIQVDGVIDGIARAVPSEAFRWGAGEGTGRGLDDDDWAPHRQFLADDGMLEIALGAFLVRTGDRVVLVDAGIGVFDRGVFKGGALLESMRELGTTPDDVTDVVFTHLHFDHTGWATQDGRPVFANATYRCDVADWTHFVPGDERATRKLAPIEDRLETWDSDGPLLPGIDVRRAPGHTPGSTILVLSSGPSRALLLGDVVHCPVELLDDEWATIGDVDPVLAKRTRTALARELESSDIPVAAAHFPGLAFGRLLATERSRTWMVQPATAS
jgi:glyoxylase-like metal-dependent hydrolase (beta-lactamase superfamily II)